MIGRRTVLTRPGRPTPAAAIERLKEMAALASGSIPGLLRQESPSGRQDRLPGPRSFLAMLSGSGPPYSFAEVYSTADTPGAWPTWPGGRTSSAAYELNGTRGLAGRVVEVHPVASGKWYWFRYVSKGGGKSTGGGVGLVGCPCVSMPDSLTLTSCSALCNYGLFQSASLMYVPDLSAYFGGIGGLPATDGYVSVDSYAQTVIADRFQYIFYCFHPGTFVGNSYALGVHYISGGFSGSTTPGLYVWQVGARGNSCSPGSVSLTNGTAFPGSDAGCCLTVSGGGGASAPCFNQSSGFAIC